jgi:hypothetical protein
MSRIRHTVSKAYDPTPVWEILNPLSKSLGFERIRIRISVSYFNIFKYVFCIWHLERKFLNLSPIQGLCVLCGGVPLRGADTAGTGGGRGRTATSDGLLRGTVSSFAFCYRNQAEHFHLSLCELFNMVLCTVPYLEIY